jgi:hypothetical protein
VKRSIALAIPALLLTAACGGLADILDDGPTVSVAVESDAYVGVWAGFQSSARYDLRADGTFTATGVPVGQLGNLYERTGRVGPFHGHGHWRLGNPTKTSTPIAREAVLDFDELLDADNTQVQPRGTLQFYATMPRDPTAHALLLETEGDYFQRLR